MLVMCMWFIANFIFFVDLLFGDLAGKYIVAWLLFDFAFLGAIIKVYKKQRFFIMSYRSFIDWLQNYDHDALKNLNNKN